MHKKTVYLTGAGPGDCKLITVKALELIKRADCIMYDYLANFQLLKFADKKCELIYVGKKGGSHALSQDKINQLLAKKAKKYNTMVRLKGGDPFIFGRGAEEARFLKKKGINFDIVPGVTSAIAAPSYAGIPLTERTKNSTVGFITGHEDPTKKYSAIDWDALTKALGTMVFLMGVKNLPQIVKKLIDCGKPKTTPVALIRWGTTSKQKTIKGNLGNIIKLARKNKIIPPAIIVVGGVVDLRKELNWFEGKALFGKKVIITRTRQQAGLLSDELIDLGAEVIEISTIKIVSLKADEKIKDAFKNTKYDWIFFTSQNGVREFSDILNRIGKDSRIFSKSRICVIGSETAKSLTAIGIKPDYFPSKFVSEEIIKHFINNKCIGRRALILQARQARDVLAKGLKKAGLVVDMIGLYDIGIVEESKKELKNAFKERIDFVTFVSSSAVNNFVKLLGKKYRDILKGTKIASIGPVTSQALGAVGLKVDIEAKIHTIKGLAEAIAKG